MTKRHSYVNVPINSNSANSADGSRASNANPKRDGSSIVAGADPRDAPLDRHRVPEGRRHERKRDPFPHRERILNHHARSAEAEVAHLSLVLPAGARVPDDDREPYFAACVRSEAGLLGHRARN